MSAVAVPPAVSFHKILHYHSWVYIPNHVVVVPEVRIDEEVVVVGNTAYCFHILYLLQRDYLMVFSEDQILLDCIFI